MKLSSVWWAGSDDYIRQSIAEHGLPVPEKICGVPLSLLLEIAREGKLAIEWISIRGYLIFKIDGLDKPMYMGAYTDWDEPNKLSCIALNFEEPATPISRKAAKIAEAAGYSKVRLGPTYSLYKDFLSQE